MEKEIKDAKFLILTCPFEPPKTKIKHGLEIKSAEDYEKYMKWNKNILLIWFKK